MVDPSLAPSVDIMDDDYYVVWQDDGDLTDRDSGTDAIIFRGYVDGDWNDAVLIKTNNGETSEIYSSPRIKATESGIFAAWVKDLGRKS